MRISKSRYCCDTHRPLYDDYYTTQAGSGLPVFVGARMQRGHGIGSVLGGLFRSAMPLIKKGVSTLGKQALRTGLEFAGDLLQGKTAKEAAVDRSKMAAANLLNKATSYVSRPPPPGTSQRGIKRRTKARSGTSKKTKRRATSHGDIFS